MKKSIVIKSVLLLVVSGLVACGGSDKTHSSTSSSTPASSSAASSSVAAVSTVMEVGREYPYKAETKITNTGTTDLVVTKKHYWDEQKTMVILVEGSATID